MKKTVKTLLKILAGLILTLCLLAFVIPLIFRDKIKSTLEKTINESVNARVTFSDYKLGFFRNFPNLTFSLEDVSVTGISQFEKDTLAGFRSFNLVLNLPSLLSKSGYEIRSAVINEASVKALVLSDGTENWNIMKESEESAPAGESTSSMKILLRKVDVLNSRIAYIDKSSSVETYLDDVNFNLNGDMTLSKTNLHIFMDAGQLTYLMDGTKYLNSAKAEADINVLANLDSMTFDLKENYLKINDLKLNFAGIVAMPGDDIKTDLTFNSENTSLKSLMSLIPAVYMKDYEGLKTSGEVALSGTARGVYSDADSTLPDIELKISINSGLVSYPSLPEQIRNINLNSDLFVDGKNMDGSKIDVSKLHMELAGNPFDLKFSLRTPLSDPDFSASLIGKIDLGALSKAVPTNSMDLSGLINMSVNMAGKMSMLEKKQYEKFRAEGNLSMKNMMVRMTSYPEIKISNAIFRFSPAFASLEQGDINIGKKSDFSLNGKIENYIPYMFSNDIIKGNLSVHSRTTDLSEIMAAMADTAATENSDELATIKVPENVNFDLSAMIDHFSYKNIKAENVKGQITIRNGILSLRETTMNILGGAVNMSADYDTRDTLKPAVRAEMALTGLGVRDAFTTFNTVQKLAPTAKGIDGKIGVKLSYNSLLGRDLMPVLKTISGGGKLQSDEITLVESSVYKKMKEVLKLGENYSNTFKDLNISFKINEGRIYVSPFNARAGNLKLNIGGDQGIDQTLNYIIKAEMPRSDLGNKVNSLIDNLSSQAAAFGFAFKPAETIRVNVKVSGTFLKPVISPFFGNTPPDSSSATNSSLKSTVQQAAETAKETVKNEVKTQAQEQADKLIKEAEEKGQILRDEAASAADKIRKEADIQAQRLIKEAESKGTVAQLAAAKGAESIRKEADKRSGQLIKEADEKAVRLVEEAKLKRNELLK